MCGCSLLASICYRLLCNAHDSFSSINVSIHVTTTPEIIHNIDHSTRSNSSSFFPSKATFSSIQHLASLRYGLRIPRIIQARQNLKRSFSNGSSSPASVDIPKGYFAIYVGEQEKRRFVVSLSLLSEPKFQELLHQAEEEFGYNHPMGGLKIPCSEDVFTDLASFLGAF